MTYTTAFVFPGQGSQCIGMLSELASHYSIIQERFIEVSDRLGYDVWKLVQYGPESLLNQTEYTQVAMLTADVAVFDLLQQETELRAEVMAGHSLGEYAALVAAGALNLADGAELVAKRGQMMQKTIPLDVGAMAAIVGLSDSQVNTICHEISDTTELVHPANYNAIGQVVIAGHKAAVERAMSVAESMGARMARIIPVSVPCHCPLLIQAAELFSESLKNTTFKIPSVPVVSNVDVSIYETPEVIRQLLEKQLYCPVRWVETIQFMKNNGVKLVVESGPGKVLTGLVKRIDKSIHAISVNDVSSLKLADNALQVIA